MKVSDYVIKRLEEEGVRRIFMVVGGSGMHLIDSLGKNRKIDYVCNHHEQASLLAAEGHQRIAGGLGVALVTTGPASTNALTGVLCSWNDSIPMLIMSGQANSKSLIGNTGLRQRGAHEVNITKIVESVTKYAVTITDPNTVKYHLEKAIYLSKSGRPGPTWLDFPLDIQTADINPDALPDFDPQEVEVRSEPDFGVKTNMLVNWFKSAERPIIVLGYGLRLSNTTNQVLELLNDLQIPCVHTKNAFDLVSEDFELCAGQLGTYGKRSGNFAVQNADLILFLGCRLSFPTVGYSSEWFGREAKIVTVDIDKIQQANAPVRVDMKINALLQDFVPLFTKGIQAAGVKNRCPQWVEQCKTWRKKYPVVTPDILEEKNCVNSYYFFDALSDAMSENDIMVADQGATFYCFSVAMKLKKGQRAYTNGGFSALGYGFPAAVGSCFANNKQRVISVNGDGGFQMNIQEMQTVAHHNLPLKIFIFENQGYTSIKHTQMAYMDGFLVGSDPASGLSCPSTKKIADAYGFPYFFVSEQKNLKDTIVKALNTEGPVVVEVKLDPIQEIRPKVSTKKLPDGRLLSKPLEDMYPFLPQEEFRANMIVKPVPEEG